MENLNQRKWDLFVIPGSHFDLGWCASPAETFAYGDLIIREAIEAIIGDYPEYRFTVEYALFLKHFLDTFPDYKPIVKQLIGEGKFEVSALWTGMMDQILDGESAIRNVILAKRWAKEELGIELITAQSSDCPGHTIQLPQILAKCGVKYLAYSRYSAPIPLHKWISPDGSCIVASNHSVGLYRSLPDAKWAGSGYGWGLIFMQSLEKVEQMLPVHLKDIEDLWPKDQLVLMGAESDLIPAYTDMVEKVKKWNERHSDIQLEFHTISQFFKNVKPENLPVYRGEAPYEFHTLGACFPATFIQAKYANNMLTSAEKMSSLQEILGLGKSNKASLDNAWAGLTIPHDHNVGGRHGEINDVVRQRYVEQAMVSANNVSEEAMTFIMTQIDYKNSGIPIVLFNPLSWERSIPIETYIETGVENVENIAVFDSSGKQLPTQFLRSENQHGYKRVHFLFVAEDMPSVGYKAFYVRFLNNAPVNENSSLKVSQTSLENQYLKIALENGAINSIFWKQSNIELSGTDDFGNMIVRENIECDVLDNLTGNVWNEVGKEKRFVEVIENGPVRVKLSIESEILDCPVTKEISLYEGLPHAELSITINWAGERNREVLLSMLFNVPDGEITYETPYGHVNMAKDEMPGTYRGEGGRHVQKWIDVSNEKFGICIGTDSVSNILNGTEIKPMLIRTAYSCGTPHHWYDNIGKHNFKFSLLPHSFSWNTDNAFRIGWEHCTITQVGRMNICAPLAPIKGKTFLPQIYSLCKVSSNNVVLSTIKKSDNENGYVIRLVEICRKSSDISLDFGFMLKGAWKTDLLEQNIEEISYRNNRLDLHISPYEICTVRILPGKGIL